jgi:IS1 family transposase/transposase-like protein
MTCKFCGGECVKNGHQKNGKQRIKCKNCQRKQQEEYRYLAYNPKVNDYIVGHIKEAVGIRSLARLLQISTTTLMARILEISKSIVTPHIVAGSVYEVDEIKTFVGRKKDHIWVAYALDRKDKSVGSFSVGPRTNETLSRVLDKLNNAKRIYTDRLRQYKTLIHPAIHKTTNRGTNHIERHNLTVRTHIKRLTRRTICFSRKIAMLYAVLKIYFWG